MSRIEVKMPQMGVSVTEGIVSAWHRAAGDAVRQGEPLCDVSTDKVDTEVTAPADGTVAELVVAEGDTVDVGAALAVLTVSAEVAAAMPDAAPTASNGSGAADAPPATTAPTVQPAATDAAPQPPATDRPAAVPDRTREREQPARVGAGPFDHAAALDAVASLGGDHDHPPASPVARRVAQGLGIDLTSVVGSGARGRIRKADVLAAQERRADTQPSIAASPSIPQAAAPSAPDEALPRGYDDVPYEIVPTSRIRKVTADHMIMSRQTAAHMTTEVEVDMTRVWAVRSALNATRLAAGEGKLSFLPFITRVACHALREHPNLNATFDRERYVRWGEVNVGIAVDTPQGLLVPVVRRAHELTVEAIGDRITSLAADARDKALDADAFRAGTFTISNPGSVGAVSAMAIINQPQVAILGIPAIVRRPWVVALPDGGETIAIRPILKLALTFDHRAIDGAEATRAAVLMKASLEAWDEQDYR